jgi:hypothetical protein
VSLVLLLAQQITPLNFIVIVLVRLSAEVQTSDEAEAYESN